MKRAKHCNKELLLKALVENGKSIYDIVYGHDGAPPCRSSMR